MDDIEEVIALIEGTGNMEMKPSTCFRESPVTSRSPTEPLSPRVNQPENDQVQPESTALHLAVEHQDISTIKELMSGGASAAALDGEGLTPLHLCIVNRFIEPFAILLTYNGSADVQDASGLSVLHVAVLHRWCEGVSAALAAGANVTVESPSLIPQDDIKRRYQHVTLSHYFFNFYEYTLVHLAVKSGDIEILEKISTAFNHTRNLNENCLNLEGVTPLYTAIEIGNLEAVQVLLKTGANVNWVSERDDTALHVAVHKPHILKYLLDKTDVKNCSNCEGTAPIHIAISINKLQSVRLLLDCKQQIIEYTPKRRYGLCYCAFSIQKTSRQQRVRRQKLKSFVHYEPQVMFEDGIGNAPLHIAAKQRNMSMIALLLQRGAKLSTIGGKGRTALEIIAREFYNPSKCFELIFDDFISTKQVVSDTIVNVNYEALTNNEGASQMKVIEDLVRCGQKKTLVHPLIESLLYLKWKHLLPVFYAMIVIYTTFLVTFNVFVVNIIHFRDKNNNSFYTSMPNKGQVAWFELYDGWYWLLITLIYTSITLLLLQELFYMCLRRLSYFLTLETWVKLSCLVLGGIVPIAESVAEPAPWHRHAASTGLLLSWLQAMFLVSRFPKWGYYVLIFGKVTINIFKILLTSVCLVIGFSFCFMIEYQSAPPFDDPFAAFVKTVVMMSSEFDYEDLFGNDHDNNLRDTKTVIRLVFVIFVVFVAIILMNFMIGIAVSDINDLQMAGSIRRLEKQVELLSSLDVLVNNRLLGTIYKKKFGRKTYHEKISNYVGYQSKWKATLYSEECYHIDLPSTLHSAIIDIAWKKEVRDEKNSIVDANGYKLNALYNAVVDRPVVTDEVSEEEENMDMDGKKPREEQSRLNKQIKLLADGLSEVKNDMKDVKLYIGQLNQITSDITTMKEMLASLAKCDKNKSAN